MFGVRVSLAVSLAETYLGITLNFAAIVVLSRLLTPQEIGVFSVAAGLVATLHTLRDFGVSNYLIQVSDITRERAGTVAGVAIALGWGLAALLYFISEPVGHYYAEPGVSDVLRVMAFSFLILPLSSPGTALLRREMAFGRLFVINTSSTFLRVTISVALAYWGFGYMSLAWGNVVGALATLLVLWLIAPDSAFLRPRMGQWRDVFTFGGKSTVMALCHEFSLASPSIVLGRVRGFESAGYFSRAFGYARLLRYSVTAAVNAVALPYMAQRKRDGSDVYQNYLMGLNYLLAVAWPLYMVLALLADALIPVLFGDQWLAAVAPAQILCFALALESLSAFMFSTLMGIGAIDGLFPGSLGVSVTRIVLVLVTAPLGLSAVAAAFALTALLGITVYLWTLKRTLSVRLTAHNRVLRDAVLLTLAVGGVSMMVDWFANAAGWGMITPGVVLPVASLIWVAGIRYLRHPLGTELARLLYRRRS